ncbi:MAG: dihydropyrimidinase [Candidatus Bathyarchaeia archaeon]
MVKNGRVVWPDVTLEADLAIDDGKIVGIGRAEGFPKADRVIDAAGKFVMPGGIDPHVHMQVPFMGATTLDKFDTGTMAAAIGGTTTVIDFAFQQKGRLPMDAIDARRKEADGKVAIDYSLHSNLIQASDEAIAQIPKIIEYGIPSFKFFMVYRKEELMIDDGNLIPIIETIKRNRGLAGCHTENVAMIEYLQAEAIRKGNRSPIYHALTRPPLSEAEAINRALYISKYLDAAFYDYHLSVKEGVEMIREARSEGRPIYCETTTHYLTLTDEMLKRPDGLNFICSPPLRSREHVEALWQGLADGTVSTVASDQAAFTLEHKKMGKDSFDKVPNGLPGMEFRVPILFSEGVQKGRISINRMAAVASTNVAKIFGLYPKKGAIQVGSDADLVIIDPEAEKKITIDGCPHKIDWSPFEGMKLQGGPVMTISKGRVVAENGKFVGKVGAGEFVKAKISEEILRRPAA